MAVRQRASSRRSRRGDARRPLTLFDDPDVERVAKLLVEYGERWEGVGKDYGNSIILGLKESIPAPLVAEEGVVDNWLDRLASVTLEYAYDGAKLLLRVGNRERRVRFAPPDDPRREAAILVHLESNYGLLSKLLEEVKRRERLAWRLSLLKELERYAPLLLGRSYRAPEVRLNTGDVYRDFLEAVYAAYALAPEWARADAENAVPVDLPPAGRADALVRAPVEPPLPLAEGAEGGGHLAAVELSARRAVLHLLGGERDAEGEPLLSVDEAGRTRLRALAAALLLRLERERGVLTKLAEALEERRRGLEPLAGEALLAAEVGALLFA